MKRYSDIYSVQWYIAVVVIVFKMTYTKKHKKEKLEKFLERITIRFDRATKDRNFGVWQIDHRKALWWSTVVDYVLDRQRSMQQARA